MPEKATPVAPGTGTSDTNTDEAPGTGQGFDFERSYNELRPQYTRTTQELSATRERLSGYESLFAALHDPDPEVQAEAMEVLGLEPAEDPGARPDPSEEEFVDPLEEEVRELRDMVAELRERSELEATAAAEAETIELRDDFIGQYLDYLEAEHDQKFTDSEAEVLGNLAIAMAGDDDVPDVQGAYERVYGEQGVVETNRSRWIESKTGAAQPPLGTTIPAEHKPRTSQDRIRYMDERWRALQDQQ